MGNIYSNNIITIDGRDYMLTDEQIERIKHEIITQNIKNYPFDYNSNDEYYFINSDGKINMTHNLKTLLDNERHSIANYCRDSELLQQRAWHEILNRQLWRYSEKHGGGEKRGGYFVYYSGMEDIRVGHCTYAGCGDVYFKKKEVAEDAIKEIVKPFIEKHPNFKW